MFIIEKYADGTASYAYEAGDRVILEEEVRLYDLWGGLIQTYKAGEVVTITSRSSNNPGLIPELLDFYRFNDHFDSKISCTFKPENPEAALPKPKAFVVPWYEGKMQKYSLVAARTAKEALEICFRANYFTSDRMKGIKIGEVFEKLDWNLPAGERWISIHRLP